MVTAVTLALAGPMASALLSHDADGPVEPIRVFPHAKALGEPIAACGGVAPKDNDCSGQFPFDQCVSGPVGGERSLLCFPQIKNTLAYTGTVRASLYGISPADGSVVSIWEECRLVAGQRVSVGGVGVGACQPDSDAYLCPGPDGRPCGYYMVPPFSYGGLASPALRIGSPVGPWQVAVVR